MLTILLWALAYLGLCFIIFAVCAFTETELNPQPEHLDSEMVAVWILVSLIPLFNLAVLFLVFKSWWPSIRRFRLKFYFKDEGEDK